VAGVTSCCATGACCCGQAPAPCACAHPLVSVITPTWERHPWLLERCIPSVYAQDYPNIEHVIASDGPDPELAAIIAGLQARDPEAGRRCPRLVYTELAEHPEGEHWGSYARLAGLQVARGDYIAYLDDDDLYLPRHCSTLVSALNAHPEAGFAYSQMQWADGSYRIGLEEPLAHHIGTPMIMHRREILEHGTWGKPDPTEDWNVVESWLRAGVRWHFVPESTVLIWQGAEDAVWVEGS
jgi:glycosyltransferase involved in cell wall biosynthesis